MPLTLNSWHWLCLALENVQSELFDMKTKYDEATSAKYVDVQIVLISLQIKLESNVTRWLQH